MNLPFAAPDERKVFLTGLRDAIIIIPSYLPFALVCGVASVQAGLTTSASLALPALVFGGSSQAVMLQMMLNAGELWVAILSGIVVNLRMAIYSAALAPKVRHLPFWKRAATAAFLVDNTFALTQKRAAENPEDPHFLPYYAGMSAAFWPGWVAFCAIGVLAGNILPASWQLDFAIPLSFIAIAAMSVRGAPLVAAALAGGGASLALYHMPLKLGLIAACLIGLAAGLFTQWVMSRKAAAP